MKNYVGAFLLVFIFAAHSVLLSQESIKPESTTESWYTYWGLGYASVSYPDELQEIIDFLEGQSDVAHTSISLDVLGFYWHLAPKTIAGVIINGAGDRFEARGTSFQINQYIYGGSVMHYMGKSFGSGPFLRGDVGLAKLAVSGSGLESVGSESGFGFLGGGGWSFDFGGTRLLLNINYAYRGVESETYNVLGFSVGGLF
jgi:hypothetical protein